MADLSTTLISTARTGHSVPVTLDELVSGIPGLATRSRLVVDAAAVGSYSEDGSEARPFRTLQAAINAATPGTAIAIKPGTYSENIVMRDLDGVAIVGTSEANTILQNASPGHTFSWVPGAVAGALVNRFAMANLEIVNTDTANGSHAVHIDADAVQYPNTFCAEEFDIHTVDAEGNGAAGNTVVYFRNVGRSYWTHGDITGGDLYVTNPSEFITRQVQVGTLTAPTNFVAEYDGNNHRNGLGRSNITIAQQSVVYGDLQLKGHPIFQMDQSSLIVGNVTGVLTSFYAAGRDYCPILSLRGNFGLLGGPGGSITLTFPDPQSSGAAYNYVDLSQAHILGNVSLTKTNFLPANSRGFAYISGQADFHAGAITTSGAISLDLNDAAYIHSNLSVGAGSFVTRDSDEFVSLTASRAARTDDSGIILKCNHASAPIVITIDADAAVGWSKAEKLELVQYGAASATFAAGAGVTVRGSAPAPAQYYTARIRRIGANEWVYC